MPNQDELIGSQLSVDGVCDHIAADSLGYLSIEGMLAATELPADSFCTACFSSRYPIPIPQRELQNKHVLEGPNIARRPHS
jgi:amidophosphoribosyltransferase